MNVSVICPIHIASAVQLHQVTNNLAWLQHQHYPNGQFEVILVDNDSDPAYGTRLQAFADRCGYRYADYAAQRSSYAARNQGLKLAKHSIVAFIDADCMPDINWLHNGVSALKQHGGIIAGHIEMTFAGERLTPTEYADQLSHLRQRDYAANGYAATANLFTDWENFSNYGLFPEVQSLGDREWCQRSGLDVTYCADAIVYHPARTKLSDLLHKVAYQARAKHRLSRIEHLDIRFWLPIRFWKTALSDPTLPNRWQRLQFIAIIHLMRWCCLAETWRSKFDPPESPRLIMLNPTNQTR